MPSTANHVNPSLAGRAWGDGHGRQADHLINDISFRDGWVACTCEEYVYRTDALSLEDAWDTHRGRADLVLARALDPERQPQASNGEVSEFLDLVRNPEFEFTGGDA